jgi:excisionase family DNA binding protein
MDSLLRASDVAPLLSLKSSTIYDLAERGILPHIRIADGRKRPIVRFRRADVEAFLRERTLGPSSSPRSHDAQL